MDCPECGTETIDFPVPEELARYLPGDDSGATLCPHCLTVQPLADAPSSTPSFDGVPTAFPDGEAAVPMALVFALLPSLATYREELSELLLVVERAGTDPLLVLDRLADDPAVDPAIDLRRRRRQLEQLL